MLREEMNLDDILKRSHDIAQHIRWSKDTIISILTNYETYLVAQDEIERTLDLLENLDENSEYFQGVKVNKTVVFLPSNQPLYAFFCFAVIPSFMSLEVCVRMPKDMNGFFRQMMMAIELEDRFNNIKIIESERNEFLSQATSTRIDEKTNQKIPTASAVIFTGKTKNADRMRKLFSSQTLFIANGSGHNPVIITESADIKQAIHSVLKLQLYNQGQDCAAPNSILVYRKIYDIFLTELKKALSKVGIGNYRDSNTLVGPITKLDNLKQIQNILIKNYQWIDGDIGAVIDIKKKIVFPVIIKKPLEHGGNYTESFAPVFFIQKYENENELSLYFENDTYRKNAMYLTIFGKSTYFEDKIKNDLFFQKNYGIIIQNTNLHASGVERGVNQYGGYGRGASYLSINGIVRPQPTLPQRDIYEILIKKNMEGFGMKKEKIDKNKILKQKKHWSQEYVDKILEKFPDKEVYTCASGISPSGTVHFGNFRDVITSYAVYKELVNRGKKARMIFSWDDFDRFRKVPQGIDSSFEQYVGLPLSMVPSPDGKEESYAKFQEKEFEKAMEDMDIDIEYRYQTDEYLSGKYDKYIVEALQKRKEIAKILLSFMTEKGKMNKEIKDNEYTENYYPVSVYSRFNGKDNTRIIDYDGGSKITYKCFDTDKTETVDIKEDHIVKLAWKVDWAMRWKSEDVVFEPGGKDHSTPGGSYDTSRVIAREIFDVKSPIYQGYEFVGIRGLGGKMSGSKGNSISPSKLLEIYTPEILKWLYFRTDPQKSFSLAFDSEVYRQYVEFDKEIEKIQQENEDVDKSSASSISLSGVNFDSIKTKKDIPFRQAVGLGQIVQWNKAKLLEILKALEYDYSEYTLDERLERAKAWLETYNKDEVIRLNVEKNTSYIQELSENDLVSVRKLKDELKENPNRNINELNKLVYGIVKDEKLDMKENAKKQRDFFKIIYNLLISRNTGPRLATFLWSIEEKERIIELLNV